MHLCSEWTFDLWPFAALEVTSTRRRVTFRWQWSTTHKPSNLTPPTIWPSTIGQRHTAWLAAVAVHSIGGMDYSRTGFKTNSFIAERDWILNCNWPNHFRKTLHFRNCYVTIKCNQKKWKLIHVDSVIISSGYNLVRPKSRIPTLNTSKKWKKFASCTEWLFVSEERDAIG